MPNFIHLKANQIATIRRTGHLVRYLGWLQFVAIPIIAAALIGLKLYPNPVDVLEILTGVIATAIPSGAALIIGSRPLRAIERREYHKVEAAINWLLMLFVVWLGLSLLTSAFVKFLPLFVFAMLLYCKIIIRQLKLPKPESDNDEKRLRAYHLAGNAGLWVAAAVTSLWLIAVDLPSLILPNTNLTHYWTSFTLQSGYDGLFVAALIIGSRYLKRVAQGSDKKAATITRTLMLICLVYGMVAYLVGGYLALALYAIAFAFLFRAKLYQPRQLSLAFTS